MEHLLEVQNLSVTFRVENERINAVKGVSFSVSAGRTHCIVGESGSGKSVLCNGVLGLTPGNGVVQADRIYFKEQNLLTLSEKKFEKIRGADIGMVFQDPMSSLNPVHAIGSQISESLMLHKKLSSSAAKAETLTLLKLVGIPEPKLRIKEYPHQLSGGMCQRVMIAMALSCRPSLLIADEPTTALDVTVQAQILDLINRLKKEMSMSIILITHDLGVVAEMADDVSVMRNGELVEAGKVEQIFNHPTHPYTQELLSLVPRIDHPSPVYTIPTHRSNQ